MTADLKLVKAEETTRTCMTCGVEQPIVDFYLRSVNSNIRRLDCKTCRGLPQKQARAAARAVKVAEKAARTEAVCSGCGKRLPIESFRFYTSGACVGQRKSKCTPCYLKAHGVNARKRRAAGTEKRKERTHPEALYQGAKHRAKADSLPFDLTLSDIFIPDFCPVLGIRLVRGVGKGTGPRDSSPTVDRLIPSLGYVRDNIAVISYRANRIKNDGTAAELEKIAAWMRSRGLP